MASAGGHWVKIAQGDIGSMVFVPKGKTVEQVVIGRKPAGASFPAGPGDTQTVKGLGGSTGAKLVQDENGNLYVRKKGANPGHLVSEGWADDYYRSMGVDVPEHKMYGGQGSPVKLARYVEGQTLAQAQQYDKPAYNKAVAKLQDNFAADALLGNWDVIGLAKDNILIGKDGKPWRIDNGGALAYRAMGSKKGSAWGTTPGEIFSMRVKGQAGSIFGKMSLKQVVSSIDRIKPAAIKAGKSKTVTARYAKLREFSKIYKARSAKGWSDAKIEAYIKDLWGIGG